MEKLKGQWKWKGEERDRGEAAGSWGLGLESPASG